MLPELSCADDEDWAAFQAADADWFLKVAGRAVRKWIGWHLYPNIEQTSGKLRVGAKGVIMLPSRFVTAVEHVKVHLDEEICQELPDPQHGCLRRGDYEWHQGGWIDVKGWANGFGWYGAYWYGSDPVSAALYRPGVPYAGLAEVKFRHGYQQVPVDVKEVLFEVAEQAQTLSSGNITSVEAPMFRLSLSQPAGLTLNDDQKNRLSSYRVPSVV